MTQVSSWFVHRSFRFGGRDYKVGEPFDCAKASCSERRLRQLADKRLVGTEEGIPKSAKPAPQAPKAPTRK